MPTILDQDEQRCQVSKLHCLFCGSCCYARGSLLHLDMGSCVERSPRALQSDTHLPWTPASLVNEERSASFLGATDRCILQLHAPSCLHSGPFVWRSCYSKVGTPAEFKWGSPEWSNAAKLAGDSSFHGLILTVQSVNLNISAVTSLTSSSQPGWQCYRETLFAHLLYSVAPLCPSLSCYFYWPYK